MENEHEPQCPGIQQEGGGLVDRISSLPNHLLGRILSLLPLKQAVKTSILSSKWRYMWTFVRRLALVYDGDELEKFGAKVEHVLRHCQSMYLDLINFVFPEMEDFSRIDEWVSSAINCYPKVLTLEMAGVGDGVPTSYSPRYPRCVLSYNMMVELYLYSFFDVEIPDSVASFPHLKRLDFAGWYPYHTSMLRRLISSCPVLEDLRLCGYFDPYVQLELDISIPTLHTLYLDLKYIVIGDDNKEEDKEHSIIINTSNLKCLHITDGTQSVYIVRNLESISSAHIDYRRSWEGVTEYVIDKLLLLLKGVAKAEHLVLGPGSFIILEATPQCRWPMFINLTTLKLWIQQSASGKLLRFFLETSPNLECLSLYQMIVFCEEDDWEDHVWNDPLEEVPRCLKLNLRVVRLEPFKGSIRELELVKYLLNNAQVLELMLILNDDPLDGEMVEKISMFPRASKTCQVHVCQGGVHTRFGDVDRLLSKFPHARR